MSSLPNGHGLLIAEKDSVMRKLESIYNKIKGQLPFTLDFEKFHGHVVELAPPGYYNPEWGNFSVDNLPMIPPQWKYIPAKDIDIKTKELKGPVDKRYLAVKQTLETGKYNFIICATDPEREGNLIFDAFMSTMNANIQATPKYRFWSTDTSDTGFENGLRNLYKYSDKIRSNTGTFQQLSDAALLRAKMDWLIGLNATTLISSKAGFTISSGRVRNPILDIIVTRELEIKNFIPKQYFTLKMIFNQNGQVYEGNLLEDGKNTPRKFDSKEEAEKLKQELLNSPSGAITEVKKTKVKELPPEFYHISSLQGAAARILGYNQKLTLQLAQSLYEKTIATYARTDSNHITLEMAENQMSDVLTNALTVPELSYFTKPSLEQIKEFSKDKRYVNDDKVRGHAANQPTPHPDTTYHQLTEMEQKLFYLIARSQLLPFLGPRISEKTVAITEVGNYRFSTTGSIMLDAGFTKAVPEYKSKDVVLPNLVEGAVTIGGGDLTERWTTPPKRYIPDTLNKVLENIHRQLEDDDEKEAMKRAEGIGRPSTRTDILESLEKFELIKCSSKNQEYSATDFGIELAEKLAGSDLSSPELTARFETKLQEVEDGQLTPDVLYNQIILYLKQMLVSLDKRDYNFCFRPEYSKPKEAIYVIPETVSEVRESDNGFYDSIFLEYISELEEAKKNNTPLPQFRGFYLAKKWENDTFKMTGKFTKKDVLALFNKEIIEKEFTWKKHNNKKSKVKLKFDENYKLVFVKEENSSQNEVKQLHLANQEVYFVTGVKNDEDYAFYRLGGKENGYNVWAKISGVIVQPEDFEQLLLGKTITRDDFISKKQTNFPGILSYSPTEKAIKLSFPERKDFEGEVVYNKNGHKIEKFVTKNNSVLYKLDGTVTVWENTFGHKMTLDELIVLVEVREISVDDFYSEKKQKNYPGTLIISGDKVKLKGF